MGTKQSADRLVTTRFLRKHGAAVREAMRMNDRRTLQRLVRELGLEHARVAIERR